MSKCAKVVAGVVAAGVVWVGAAWYTGTRVEHEIRLGIEQANADITAALPELQINIRVESVNRHIFSSDVRYSVTFARPTLAEGTNPEALTPSVELRTVYLADHLEHGPWPWSHLKRGSLHPIMAASALTLEHNDVVDAWFKAAQNQVPVRGEAIIGYSGAVNGKLTVVPLAYKAGSNTVAFSGLVLDVSGDYRNTRPTTLKGMIDNLQFASVVDGQPLSLYATGVSLDSNVDQNYLGETVLAMKSVGVDMADRKIHVNDYHQRIHFQQDGDKVAGSILYEVGQVQLDRYVMASGQFRLNIANLDSVALTELAEQYRQAMAHAQATRPCDEPELTEAQQQAFLHMMGKLLAGNPTMSIDPLVVRTDHGESAFNLTVDLAKPNVAELSMETLLAEALRKLDARLVVSRPMVTEWVTLQYLESGVESARAAKQAEQDVEALVSMAVQMKIGSIDHDNIVSTLSYADGQVTFNGVKMPVEAFLGQILALAMGGDGGGDDEDILMDEVEGF